MRFMTQTQAYTAVTRLHHAHHVHGFRFRYAGIRRHRQPERSHLNVVAHQHGVFGHFNGRLPFLRVRIRPLKAVLG